MTRLFILLLVAGSVAGCEQYREPRANCFNFVSRGPASQDCTYEPLGGAPDFEDEVHE